MLIIPSNYSIYLNNTLNYKYTLKKLDDSFSFIYDLLLSNKKISTTFKEDIFKYPKYPLNFKPILKIDNFNKKAIYEVTYETNEKIIQYLDLESLSLRKMIDKIAIKEYDMEFDYSLERSFVYGFNDLYNFNKYFISTTLPDPHENLYYNIVGPLLEEYTNNCDFFQSLINQYVLNNLLENCNDFNSQLSKYFINFDIFNKINIKNDFENFINNYKDELEETLTDTILTHHYMTLYSADGIKKIIKNSLSDNIDNINKLFSEFIDDSKINFNRVVVNKFSSIFINSFAKDLLTELLKTDNILKDKFNTEIKSKEEAFFNECINMESPYTIKNSLYLLSLYRFNPIQYINAIPIVLQDYVQRFILSDIKYEDYISKLNVSNFITKYFTYINFDNYVEFLNNYLKDDEYILNKILSNKLVDFTLSTYYLELFDEFLSSPQYNDLTVLLLESVFKALNKDGLIEHTFNWYEKRIYIDLLFKTFFRNYIIKNKLFQSLKIDLENILTDIFNHRIYNILDEKLEGNINGVNFLFVLKHKIREENLEIYNLNSDNTKTIIDPSKYYILSDINTISFIHPPLEEEKLYANYETDYDISVSYLYSKNVDTEKHRERMIGVINGNNKIFKTKFPFVKNTLKIIIQTDWEEYTVPYTDYIIQEDNETVIFKNSPFGNFIFASYTIINEDLTEFNGINLEWFYKSICRNSNTIDYIYKFMESFHYSSVVKQYVFDKMKALFIEK
jgi:hypothetical protein